MANLQMAMFAPKSEWVPPLELPDITSARTIAIDVETCLLYTSPSPRD